MTDMEYFIDNFIKHYSGPEYERAFLAYRRGLIIIDEVIDILHDIDVEMIKESFKGG